MATTIISGVQYSGIWTMQQVNAAIAAGTWPSQPGPALFSWGQNNLGQLGLGNTTYFSSPKQVGSLVSWSSLTSGSNFTLAIKTDGSLYAWGQNASGQLGLGNTTNYSSPKQVGALTTWLNIAAGIYYFCGAIKTDGTLWTWGNNGLGTLGLGNGTTYSSPKQVGALTNWLKITAGYVMQSIKTDGTLWGWGYQPYGALGLGNTTGYSSPKQVGVLTNWSTITAGNHYSISAKTDGTLWSWGYNAQGQLGLGDTTNRSSPVQVGAYTSWSNAFVSSNSSAAILS